MLANCRQHFLLILCTSASANTDRKPEEITNESWKNMVILKPLCQDNISKYIKYIYILHYANFTGVFTASYMKDSYLRADIWGGAQIDLLGVIKRSSG